MSASILERLLDLHEKPGGRLRAPAMDAPRPDGLEARGDLREALDRLRQAGAVALDMEPAFHARNTVRRIRLADADAAYRLLGRTPRSRRLLSAEGVLHAATGWGSCDAIVRDVAASVMAGWQRGLSPHGLSMDAPERAAEFLKALAGVLATECEATPRPMRAISQRATGDSKAIERHMPMIARILRRAGRVPEDTSDAEALAFLGVEPMPQPVLLAGPVISEGVSVSSLPWVGLPGTGIPRWRSGRPVRTLLTIENLASFQEHAGRCRNADEVTVYTGGYPSRDVARAIRQVVSWNPAQVLHWGDMDPHGLLIALHVERIAGRAVRPHLMDTGVARSKGRPAPPMTIAPGLVPDWSGMREVSRFLASAEAHHLEQEHLPPARVDGIPAMAG